MPSVNDMIPSKWLKAADFDKGEKVFTISACAQEKLGQPDKQESKYTLAFKETPKKLALNNTNIKMLGMILGPESDAWVGKQITLYKDITTFKGSPCECVRLRKAGK